MAIIALNSATTALRALSTKIDVIANNLANTETTAFKRQRCNLEDLTYLTLKQPGANGIDNQPSPTGIQVGLGTRVSNTQLEIEQGPLEPTQNPLDVAIQGFGFFKVQTLPAIGGGSAYTRNGNFFINSSSELVLGLGDGYKLDPSITIPQGTSEISISETGEITGIKAGSTVKSTLGQLKLASFTNPQGLKLLGGSLYAETDASGPPTLVKPGDSGAGKTLQGFLESSNVDPVTELVTLIKTQRAFELNSQVIQTTDQTLQTIANLRRG